MYIFTHNITEDLLLVMQLTEHYCYDIVTYKYTTPVCITYNSVTINNTKHINIRVYRYLYTYLSGQFHYIHYVHLYYMDILYYCLQIS